MTKAVITGGAASFEKNRKVADFESEKAGVSFSVGEGEDAAVMVAEALNIAKAYVFTALGYSRDTNNAPAVAAAAVAAGTAKAATKAPKATKTPPVVPPATPAADPLAGPAPSTQPTLVEIQAANQAPKVADPTDFVFGGDAPEVIPDKDILDATSRKASLLVTAHGEKGTAMLREFGAKFGVKRVSELPQPVRRQYLTELEALK